MAEPQRRPDHCPVCGQETALHPPSVREFARQFGGNYIAPSGTLWRTLACLLFRPGHLTLEWLAGRRRRYILPLRLYISLSVLFFFVLQLTAVQQHGGNAVVIDARGSPQSQLNIELGQQHWGALEGLRPAVAARVAIAKRRLEHEGSEAFSRHVLRELVTALYYALFALIPLQAAALALAFRGAGRNYGEHLLFVLNRSSGVLLMLLLLLISPWGWLNAVIVLWLLINAEREMRRVYGSWARVLWRRALAAAMQCLFALPLMLTILVYAVLA